jgi:metal-responsive CopG/Arc/MetJ family transcriptional regulator
MSTRTTVTLDDDVLIRVKELSQAHGISFRQAVNELLRTALIEKSPQSRVPFRVQPIDMGYRPELNYDSTEALLEYGEGPFHR